MSRVSSAARFIVPEIPTIEETQRIFGMSNRRVATLAKWVSEALGENETPVVDAPKAKHVTKKRSTSR